MSFKNESREWESNTIITRTPYRVSFIGGGTDYREWFKDHGGAVLGTSIDKYCYISVRYLPPFFEHKYRILYSRTEEVRNLFEIQHPTVREVIKASGITEGLEIHHDGDLPARSGIGSSSSFAVGMLNALHTLSGRPIPDIDLANEAIKLEQDVLGETVGCQDQILAAMGGLNLITFNGEIKVQKVNAGKLQENLLLVFTGFPRFASEIAKEQVSKVQDNASMLHKMQDMVPIAIDLLGKGDIKTFGELINASWQIKRRLAKNVSNQYIDFLYDKGIKAGAFGGKLLGAGGGGFLLFVVSPERRQAVIDSLGNPLVIPFRFESHGTQVIFRNGD